MCAMRRAQPRAPLRLSRLPIPFPEDNEVLIRVNKTGQIPS